MFKMLKTLLKNKKHVVFQDISKGSVAAHRAACFFEILQLKTMDKIQVKQDRPYGNIMVMHPSA